MAARNTTVDTSSTSTCKKCKKLYDDPRMLPCLHSFCKRCIGKSIAQTGSKKTVRCPTCYNTTPLPLKGVEEYPRNVRLNYETMIAKYETQILSNPPPTCDECDQDPALETVSFCYTCPGFLCKDCHAQHIRSKNLAKNHKILLLEEAKKNKDIKKELKQHIPQPPIKCSDHEENAVKFYCTTCKTLVCTDCTVIQHQGHKLEEIKKFSTQQKDKVVKSAKQLPQAVAKLEETIAGGKNMKKKIDDCKTSVDDEIQRAFNELEKVVLKRKEELLAKCKEITTAKQTSLAIQVDELTSLKDKIVACSATISEAQESYSDAELLSVVTTLQSRVEELSQQFDKTVLKLKEDDSMRVSMNTGTLKKSISVFGSVGKHQPRDYKTLNKPIMTINSNYPCYVAVHDSGDIVVTNNTENSVHVYDRSGHEKMTLGTQSDLVKFKLPYGVAISGDVMFITEQGTNSVQKWTMSAEFLSKFGEGQLSQPWACAVDSSGVIYVADVSKNYIQVFNPDGTPSHTIGDSSHTQGPEGVTIDKHGNIHVALITGKSVKVFTPNGGYIREYGKGILLGPSGVAVDDDGYCLVGDWSGKALHVFDPQGKLVHSIKYTSHVCGVTLDKEGFVYVVEYGSNKVYKY